MRNTEENRNYSQEFGPQNQAHIWQQKRAKKEGRLGSGSRLMCLSRSETGTVGSQRGKAAASVGWRSGLLAGT